MSDNSAIQWTQATWNPTTGCDQVSPGCGLPRIGDGAHGTCYALTLAARLKAMGQPRYQTDGDPQTSGPGFGITMHADVLDVPLRWRRPRRVFVNSMSDLFHDGVTDEFIAEVFAVMAQTPRHTYQVLTKRHGRMRSLLGMDGQTMIEAAPDEATALALYESEWPLPNVWVGVSVEDQKWADIRIPALLDTPAAVRFLSCEPLLGPIDLRGYLCDPPWVDGDRWPPSNVRERSFDWAIVGGESGPGAARMDLSWAQAIVSQCRTASVPAFVKQLGSRHGSKHHDMATFPPDLRVREYPEEVAGVR